MSVVCTVILLMVLFKAASYIGYVELQRIFTLMIIFGICFFIVDDLWLLLDHDVLNLGSATIPINYLVRSLYWLSTVILTYMAFCYFELNQKTELLASRTRRLAVTLPALLELFLCLVNPLTGWLFTVSPEGDYSRGPLFIVQIAIILGYLLASAFRAARAYREESNYADRDQLKSYAWFSVLIILGAVFQLFIWSMPLACVGITLAVLNLSLDTLRHLVSLDTLTQLNNRNQFVRSLTTRLTDEDRAPLTYLLIIDVDQFKQVNDDYGHPEGDRALQCVAEAMRQVIGSNENSLLGRFGGDEFLASLEAHTKSEVDQTCEHVCQEAKAQAHKVNLACEIGLSIGYAQWSPSCSTVQQMLEEADKELYQQKAEHAALRNLQEHAA